MLLRALAVLAALAIPLLASVTAIAQLPFMEWIAPLAAVACTLPIVHAARDARVQIVVAAGLAAMATAMSPEVPELLAVTGDIEAMSVHDLREAPLPPWQDGYVAVRGYLLSDWVVDEYRPEQGQRPDQDQTPRAVLLPLLGTDAQALDAATIGRVVVARVRPDRLDGPQVVTLRGHLGPVDAEIVESLFVVQGLGGGPASTTPEAVLLDTLDLPTRSQALTRAALVGGAALLSLILLMFAIPRSKPTSDTNGH